MKYLILTLLIGILLYIIIYNKEKFLINEEKWQDYRLGDIIKGYFRNKKQYDYLNKINKRLPNSIGDLYIKRTENLDYNIQNNNFDILKEIIDEKKNLIELPENDSLIIHLRIGDIIKGNKNKINFQSNHWYGTSISKLEEEIKKIKDFKKVYIVYGSHKNNINIELNNKYLQDIEEMLKKYNINPILRNKNPDEDFIFMSCSKNFIKSGGGYSQIISDMVKKNKGNVYIPK